MGRDLATELYRACNPALALPVGDPRYVELYEARGENWHRILGRSIRRSDEPRTHLLSGFPGDGKTTDLRRLKAALATGDDKRAVVFIAADEYVNRSRYTVIDVLLAIISETGRALRDDFGVKLEPSYLTRRMKAVTATLFSDVEVDKVSVTSPFDPFKVTAQVGLKLQKSHEVSKTLWEALGHERATLAEEFRKLLTDQARPALLKRGFLDLVLVVDGLEKLEDPGGGQHSDVGHEALFLDGAPVLGNLGAQVVLVIPPKLAYSTSANRLKNDYGAAVKCIPTARIPAFCDEICAPGERALAFERLRELVRLRVPEVDGERSLRRAFESDDLVNDVIEFSGGHIRTLLILVQESLSEIDALPITRAAFEAVSRRWVIGASHELRQANQHQVAAEVGRTHLLPTDPTLVETAMSMLQTLHLLAYHNQREYYEPSPAVLGIKQVRDAVNAP